MEKTRMPKRILRGLLLGAGVAVAADLLCAFAFGGMSAAAYILVFVLTAAFALLRQRGARLIWNVLFGALCALLAALVLCAALMTVFASEARYASADNGKAALYGGKKVLIIVPHEDDDLNVAEGVMEEYVKYGSEVYLLFATNGDFKGQGEKRLREALKVAEDIGIPEDRVIFLGYGDRLGRDGTSIYNCPDDEVVTSLAGRTETYGLPEHPAFREGNSYTRRHFREDLRDAMLQCRADVIICSDYDAHGDHRAVSLLMEEAMGEILKTHPDYRPVVLKAMAYSTSYNAPRDFYSENILSTVNPYDTPYMQETNLYNWADRLRLPVSADILSRSMLSAGAFRHILAHSSQRLYEKAESIINGDKVFWLRDTSSLCYAADISVSSGDGSRLNDFRLADSSDILNEYAFEGAWTPDGSDAARTAETVLPEAADIAEIRLYDSPSLDDNVLNARLSFDDGTSVETGALAPNGSATAIRVDKSGVKSFTVTLLETEGAAAGLTEIEACGEERDAGLDYIKLQNKNGDFVYDYYIDKSGQESFDIYASGEAAGASCTVSCDNSKCRVGISEDGVTVRCPAGESCRVTVSTLDGAYSDSAAISNPGRFARGTGQAIERFCLYTSIDRLHSSNTFLGLRALYRLARFGTAAGR